MFKGGFGKKLGQVLEAISPVSPQTAKGALGFGGEAAVSQGRSQIGATWNAIRGSSERPGIGKMIGSYFKGERAEDIAMQVGDQAILQAAGVTPTVGAGGRTAAQVMGRRAWQRTATVAGFGLIGMNQMFGDSDSLIGRTTGFATKVGIHGGIGMGARYMGHPMAGTAYMAWAGINMMRGGDNFGPF